MIMCLHWSYRQSREQKATRSVCFFCKTNQSMISRSISSPFSGIRFENNHQCFSKWGFCQPRCLWFALLVSFSKAVSMQRSSVLPSLTSFSHGCLLFIALFRFCKNINDQILIMLIRRITVMTCPGFILIDTEPPTAANCRWRCLREMWLCFNEVFVSIYK